VATRNHTIKGPFSIPEITRVDVAKDVMILMPRTEEIGERLT
jgi:hypothetical protein